MPSTPMPPFERGLYREIAARMRFVRQQAGVSQTDVAKLLGMGSHAAVANLEAGRQRISIEHLYRFAGAFGMKVSDFLPQTRANVRRIW